MWGEKDLLPSEGPRGRRDGRREGRTSEERMEAGGEGRRDVENVAERIQREGGPEV